MMKRNAQNIPGIGNNPGAAFAMTNADRGNEVVMYSQAADGILTQIGTYATGGMGKTIQSGDALGSQNPLIASPNGGWLFAINAGTNSISVFKVSNPGLKQTDVVPSCGDFPVSLTTHGNLLYVLNADGNGNITGFTLGSNGKLTPIPGSTRNLNAGGANPPSFIVARAILIRPLFPIEVRSRPIGLQQTAD